MKSNVIYYILLLLDSENTVRIPGLGVLTRHVHSAKILKKEWSVKPPVSTVDFAPSDKDKGKLLARFISYKSGVDPQVASEHIAEFTASVKSSLVESGRASVDYLGVFHQDGDNLHFSPDTETINAAYRGLNDVELPLRTIQSDLQATISQSVSDAIQESKEISGGMTAVIVPDLTLENEDVEHSMEETPQAPVPEGTRPEEVPEPVAEASRSRMRVPILLPIFLAIFLGVTALAVMQYNKRDALYHPAASYNRAPVQDKPIFGSGDESKTESDVTSNDEKATTEDNRTLQEVITDNAKGILGVEDKPVVTEADGQQSSNEAENEQDDGRLAIGENDPIQDRQSVENEEQQSENSRQDDVESAEGSAVVEENRTVDNDVEGDLNVNQESQGAARDDKLASDCYVIVGAFGVQSNVDRMIARLTKMGYSPASMQRRGLTQIGVPAPCGSAEVKRVLKDLQLNVEAEAWVYNK